MNTHSKAAPETRSSGRKSLAGVDGRPTTSSGLVITQMDDQIVELEYDNGYPDGFTIVDNRDIWQEQGRFRELALPLKTIGAWTVLLTFPPGWVNNVRHLRRALGVGRDQLRTILAELEEKGRLKRVQVRNPDGTYGRQRWVLRRGGSDCSPRSIPPAPESQAPVETGDREAADGPAPESQAPASTADWKAGDGLPGAGISGPLVTTEVVLNTEAITTTSPAPSTSPALIPPPSLPSDEARVVVAEVEKAVRNSSLRGDLAQPVLDELEGAVRRGRQGPPIAKPISYLRSLLKRAQIGQFVPDAGLPIGRERQNQALEVENRMRRDGERRQNLAARDDPEAQRRIEAQIAECFRALKMAPVPHRYVGPQLKASTSP